MLEWMKNSKNIKHQQIVEGYFAYTDDYDKVWWLIIRMRRLMRAARAKELLQDRITPAEIEALLAVKSIGYKATPTIVSRWLLKQPHTTSTLISRMEKKGFLKRVKDLDMKNQVRIELTEKGQQAYHQAVKRVSVRRILSALSDKELEQLKIYLEKLMVKALAEVGISQ